MIWEKPPRHSDTTPNFWTLTLVICGSKLKCFKGLFINTLGTSSVSGIVNIPLSATWLQWVSDGG